MIYIITEYIRNKWKEKQMKEREREIKRKGERERQIEKEKINIEGNLFLEGITLLYR